MLNQGIFIDITIYITAGNVVANLDISRAEFPRQTFIQSRGIDTSWNINRLTGFLNSLKNVLKVRWMSGNNPDVLFTLRGR